MKPAQRTYVVMIDACGWRLFAHWSSDTIAQREACKISERTKSMVSLFDATSAPLFMAQYAPMSRELEL